MSERQHTGEITGFVSMGVNLVLFAFKFFAGAISNSISLSADSFNNLADCGTNIAMIIGFRISAKSADKEHPFGHGRMEYVAGLLVSMVILATGFSIGREVYDRITAPKPVIFSWVPVAICAGAILAKLLLALFIKHENKRVGSATLNAGLWDSLADTLSTMLALLSLILAPHTEVPIDGYLGIGVTLFVLATGYSAFRANIDLILGHDLSAGERKAICEALLDNNIFEAIEEVGSHDYGPENRILIVKVRLRKDIAVDHFDVQIQFCENCIKRRFGFREVTIYWSPC